MTNAQMIELLDRLGLKAGTDWRLMMVDGKAEVVVSLPAMRVLAEHAPDQERARDLMAAIEERFPGE